MYIIPLTSEPNQNFKTIIPIDGNNIALIFDVRYNLQAGYWTMCVAEDLTGKMLVDSIPLLNSEYPGANLLEQYGYLNIGSCCIVKTNPDVKEDNPNSENLGTGFQLVWGNTI